MHNLSSSQNGTESLDDIKRRLDGVKAHRGFIMSNHVFLSAVAPDLLEAYENLHRAVSSTQRDLSALEKNFVWLIAVACSEVPIGGHHVEDFRRAGGTDAQVAAAVSLAMVVTGSRLLKSIAPGWSRVAPNADPTSAYENAIDTLTASIGISAGVVHAALATGQSCRRAWEKVGLHICRAKEAGLADGALVEALAVSMLPAGNPAFVQACDVWRGLIRDGKIRASVGLQHAIQS